MPFLLKIKNLANKLNQHSGQLLKKEGQFAGSFKKIGQFWGDFATDTKFGIKIYAFEVV